METPSKQEEPSSSPEASMNASSPLSGDASQEQGSSRDSSSEIIIMQPGEISLNALGALGSYALEHGEDQTGEYHQNTQAGTASTAGDTTHAVSSSNSTPPSYQTRRARRRGRTFDQSLLEYNLANPPAQIAHRRYRSMSEMDCPRARGFIDSTSPAPVTVDFGNMSPAPVMMNTPQSLQVQTLAKSIEALLLTAHQLSCKEKALQQRLKYAHNEYSKLADQLPSGPNTRTKAVAEKILFCSPDAIPPSEQSLKASDVVNTLAESGHVGEPIVTALREGLDCYQTVPRQEEDNLLTYPHACIVATRAGTPANLEKDFTTKGTQGTLRCPFSKPNNKASENGAVNGVEDAFKAPNGDACGHADLDPIKAEINERRSSQAGSARSSSARCPISRCPIRFLDQHTPEEVADYVERHKHEIPRSHAICASRYSKDSQSIDAKYGNLISMVRGLSVKHQAFLPQRQKSTSASSSSAERVEKWAESVDRIPEPEMHPAIKEEDEEGHFEAEEQRQGHFDRPLREIRVGESPSRPWGIPVPPPAAAAAGPSPMSPVSSTSPPVAPPFMKPKPPDNVVNGDHGAKPHPVTPNGAEAAPRRCPFGHGAPKPEMTKPEMTKPEMVEPETEKTIRNEEVKEVTDQVEDQGPPDPKHPKPEAPGNIVFNGPVFFGYSPEQTAAFIQQLGNLDQKHG